MRKAKSELMNTNLASLDDLATLALILFVLASLDVGCSLRSACDTLVLASLGDLASLDAGGDPAPPRPP